MLKRYCQAHVDGNRGSRPEPETETAQGDVKRSLGVIDGLGKSDQKWVIEDLARGLGGGRIEEDLRGVALVDVATSRWQRFDAPGAMNLVVLLPELGRVASFSTSEVQGNPASVHSALAPYRLRNVHYYPFFNRLKPVKGRKIVLDPPSDTGGYVQMVSSLKHILRTLWYSRIVGISGTLDAFVPVGAPDGVRMWSFSAVVGRFSDIQALPAYPAGLRQEVKATFEDGTEVEEFLMHPTVVQRAMDDEALKGTQLPVQGVQDLIEWDGLSLVVVAWPLAEGSFIKGDPPQILSWWPLGSEPEVEVYETLGRLCSTRKVAIGELDEHYPDWQRLLDRDDVVEHNGWLYYVPLDLDPELFALMMKDGYGQLDTEAALSAGYSVADIKEFTSRLRLFNEASPHERLLYQSDDPDRTLRSLYPSVFNRYQGIRPRDRR